MSKMFSLASLYEKKRINKKGQIILKYKLFKITFFKKIINQKSVQVSFLGLFKITMPFTKENLNRHFELLDIPVISAEEPLVSVIVPNYNHGKYLKKRLDSIYQQTYKNIEVILLDDYSSDNSLEILKKYTRKYPQNTRLIANDKNSGKVFHQWNKGLQLAKGEYIWIAESDDYCDKNFLKELVLGLQHQSVMLSFARSIFIQEGKKIWSLEEYLKDLPFSWNKPFVIPSHTLVKKAFAIKNVIPNVSSAVFRNIGTIPDEIINIWEKMSLCGDWLFYLWLIRGGCVSYTNRVTNYYRVHPNSTSLKIQKTSNYYIETFWISCFIAQKYAVDLSTFEKVKANLIEHYKIFQHTNDTKEIEKIYDLKKIEEATYKRLPNIAICGFSLMPGGGEIFPIYLANELKKLGVAVTFIDFRKGNYDEGVRKKLQPNIPLIELNYSQYLPDLISSFGIDIMHTHEGTTDYTVAQYIINNKQQNCKHVITLHGMYEAIEKNDLDELLKAVIPSCSCFVYIANKNLIPIKKYLKDICIKQIGNGLPVLPISPCSKNDMGIKEDAFCITLASRGIIEKGWIEAVNAIKLANKKSSKEIHLILIGEGECYNILKKEDLPPYIHLLGKKNNVRDYFAMSDMGLLPSRFEGESFPLVIIECLQSGTPVIASNIGEIQNMLTDKNGEMAGVLFNLENKQIPIEKLSDIILDLSADINKYQQLKRHVHEVAQKFNITDTAKQYLKVYKSVLEKNKMAHFIN